MIVDVRQIEDIKFKFTELGVALSDLSDQNTQTFDELKKSMVSMQESVGSFLKPEELQNLRGTAQAISKYTQDLAPMFDKIATTLGSPMINLERAIGNASQSFDRIAQELNITAAPSGEVVKTLAAAKTDKKEGKEKKEKLTYMDREKQSFMGMVRRGAGALKLPLPGAIAAGGLMLAAWGLKESDRVKKETGEALNILVPAFDAGVKGVVASASEYIGKLGDQLNKVYGISREAIQSVAKEYVAGGVKIQAMRRSVDSSLGSVGDNYMLLALGLDKMFELSSGESARRMVDMMADYGKNLEGAKDTWMTMLMAGKDSGIGAARFVKNITSAADSLKELGYDIDNVVDLAVGLQAAYQDMGVPRQMAGQQAALGLQQLAQGMTSMSSAWKMLVGEEMDLGEGVEAKQQFEDVIQRITTRGSTEEADLELQNAIVAMVKVASRGGKGDETVTREILSEEMGLGFKGTQAAMAIKKSVDSGDLKEATKVTKENKKLLMESLETERQKQSKWQRHMNLWLQGMSKIGQGLIGLITHAIADLVIYFKTLPVMFWNFITFNSEANKKLSADIAALRGDNSKAADRLWEGLVDVKNASIAGGMEAVGASAEAIMNSLAYDPLTGLKKTTPIDKLGIGGGAANIASRVAGGAGPPGPIPPQPIPLTVGDKPGRQFPTPAPVEPMIRTILVPVEQPGVYPVQPIAYGDKPQLVQGAPKVEKKKWAGGGLSIVNRSIGGVTPNGDIIVEVVGNCPRCGLIFGEDFSQMSDYARSEMPMANEEDRLALAKMLTSEVGRGREYEGKGEERKYIGLAGATRKEAVGIAYTAINRLRAGRYGSSLTDVITGGQGFGRQGISKKGKMRPYSTKREPTAAALQLADEILSGYHADPTGGATNFYHSTRGKGYGSKKHPELRTAHPKFTRGKVNTANIGRGSFWAPKKLAQTQAANAAEWREKEESMFARRHRATPATKEVRQAAMEPWELETGRTEDF